MNKFAQKAIDATTLSKIMGGKEKISTSEVIKSYPDGITVNAVDLVYLTDKKGNRNQTAVICFGENPKAFLFGGSILTNIVAEWLAMYDGNVDACNADLSAEGGVLIKLGNGKTKDGNNITTVEVVG